MNSFQAGSTRRRNKHLIAAAALAATAAVTGASRPAAAQTWVAPGDGNWNVGANWSTGTAPTSGTTRQLTFNAADAVSYTATNNIGAFTLNSLTFNNTGTGTITINSPTATGNALTFGGTNPTVNVIAGSAVIGSRLAGTATITKIGAGTVTDTADSTFTGTLIVNGGRWISANPSGTHNFNATSVVVNDGGTYQFGINGAGNPNVPGNVYHTINAGGTISWQENEAAGGFDLNGGTLEMRADVGIGHPTLNTMFRTGAVTRTANAPQINGARAINKVGSGTVTVTGVSLNNTGGLNIEEGVLATDAGLIATGNLTFGTAATSGTLRYTGPGADPGTGNPIVLAKPVVLNAGGGTIEIADPLTTLTYGAATSGGGALTKAGPGTLALTGTNLHTGGTTVTGGALQIGAGGTAGALAGDVTVAAGGTLAFNRADAIAFAGAIGGAGNLSKLGGSTLDLTGPLSYTGRTTVSAGTLRVRPFSTGAVEVAGGATLALSYPAAPGTLSAQTLTLGGNGSPSTLQFELNTSANPTAPLLNVTAENGLVLNDGPQTLSITNARSFGVGTFTLIDYSGSPITGGFTAPTLPARTAGGLVYNTADTRIDLQITGVDSIRWAGNLSSTWDVGTAINTGGTNNWRLASNNAVTNFVTNDVALFDDSAVATAVSLTGDLQPAAVTVNNTTKNFTFQGSGSLTTGSLTKQGTGSLTILTNNTYAGDTTVSAGALRIGTGGTTGSIGTGNLVNNGTVTWDRSDNVTFTGNVSGTGSITKAGGNTLALTGTYTPTGDTAIEGGTLALAANVGYTYAGRFTGAGALAKSGTGTVVLTGANTYAGGTTVTGGILQIGDGGTTGSVGTGSINLGFGTDNGTLAFNRSDDVTVPAEISGTGGVTKLGGGTVTLPGTLTYSGPTNVSAGTLVMQGSNTLFGTTTVAAGATLGVQTQGFDQTATNQFAGAGTIVKTGSGTLDLQANNNPFTGTLVINGGTVLLSDPNAGSGSNGDLGATSIVVNNGTTFQFGVGGVAGENPDIPENGYFTINAGGTVRWRVAEVIGGVNLQGGTLTFDGGGTTSSGTTTQTWTSGTINGVTAHNFAGAAPIVKTTPGTVSVTGLATLGAAVTIQDGTVSLASAANFNTNGSGIGGGNLTLGVAGGTTGRFEYLGQGDGAATRTGTVALAGPGAVRVVNPAAPLTLNGVVSGAGSMTKEGAGTLKLTGANTFAGGTTVAAGTLLVSNTNVTTQSATGTGAVTVSGGATLGGLGRIAGGVTITSGGTLAPGESAGILTIAGPVTLQGLSNTVVELGAPAGAAPTAGTDYDQLALTGTGDTLSILDGARLQVSELAGIADRQSYTIVDNRAGGAMTGLFSDAAGRALAEGSTILGSNGTPFTISYANGDVTLSTVPEPASIAAVGLAAVGLLARRGRRRADRVSR